VIAKIISGGQAGVDRAALDVGLELGIRIGGWCPRGRKAEDGPIPDRYPLLETATADYRQRTWQNIHDAHATLILDTVADHTELTGGTKLTFRLANEFGSTGGIGLFLADIRNPQYVGLVREWLRECRSAVGMFGFVLNVAGPRESKRPGIYAAARTFLLAVLRTEAVE
jgi:hypothetical protein